MFVHSGDFSFDLKAKTCLPAVSLADLASERFRNAQRGDRTRDGAKIAVRGAKSPLFDSVSKHRVSTIGGSFSRPKRLPSIAMNSIVKMTCLKGV